MTTACTSTCLGGFNPSWLSEVCYAFMWFEIKHTCIRTSTPSGPSSAPLRLQRCVAPWLPVHHLHPPTHRLHACCLQCAAASSPASASAPRNSCARRQHRPPTTSAGDPPRCHCHPPLRRFPGGSHMHGPPRPWSPQPPPKAFRRAHAGQHRFRRTPKSAPRVQAPHGAGRGIVAHEAGYTLTAPALPAAAARNRGGHGNSIKRTGGRPPKDAVN